MKKIQINKFKTNLCIGVLNILLFMGLFFIIGNSILTDMNLIVFHLRQLFIVTALMSIINLFLEFIFYGVANFKWFILFCVLFCLDGMALGMYWFFFL